MKTDLKYDEYKEFEVNIPHKKKFDDQFKYFSPYSFSHRFKFENGYGASVVKHWGSYGFEDDLFELAVLKFDEKGEGHLCYSTPITNDVLGYLNNDEVLDLLEAIKNLESDKK